MSEPTIHSDELIRCVTRVQDRLYGYIRTLLPQPDAAREVLQETNVVLLHKANELAPDQPFEAWACRVAYYEVLSYLRDHARDRHLFDEALVEKMGPHARAVAERDVRITALEDCLERLQPAQRELIARRYEDNFTVKEIAERMGQSAATLATRLFRLRQALFQCIGRQLAAEGRST